MGKTKEEVSGGKILLATVSGMKIYSDSIYVITGKMDESAPTGFQENGISKAPFPGNKTIVPCSWDKNLGVYNTGFYTNSSCYNGYPIPERQAEVNLRVKNIRNPYEEVTGKDLDQSNVDFWDSFHVDLYMGRLFYTNDINDLFDLYIALQAKALTPKEEDGNPDFSESMFCIEDKTTAVDVKKQRQLDKTDVIFKFMSALESQGDDKSKMIDLLLYLNIIHSVEINDDMTRYIFTNWIEAKSTNVDMFKETYNRFLSGINAEKGGQILKYHRMIKELAYAGRLQVGSNGVTFDGVTVGSDFPSAAVAVVDDPNLIEVKTNLFESYNALKGKQKQIVESGGKPQK